MDVLRLLPRLQLGLSSACERPIEERRAAGRVVHDADGHQRERDDPREFAREGVQSVFVGLHLRVELVLQLLEQARRRALHDSGGEGVLEVALSHARAIGDRGVHRVRLLPRAAGEQKDDLVRVNDRIIMLRPRRRTIAAAATLARE